MARARTLRFFLPPALCAIALSALGCSEDPLGRVNPKIEVDPAMIDLGPTPIGVLARHTVTVTNVGGAVLAVTSAELVMEEGVPSSVDLSLEIERALPVELAPRAQLQIDVEHLPRDEVFDAGLLRIKSDDMNTAKVDVEITQGPLGAPKALAVSDVAQADLEVDTGGTVTTTVGAISFGTVAVGVARAIEIYVVNAGTGNRPLRVENIGLVPGQSAPGLQISATPNPMDGRILLPILGSESRAAAQRSVKVILSWQPPAAGTALNATLRIETNDPARGELDIPITGSTTSADPPVMRIDPANGINFGVVGVGQPAMRSFTIYNDGGSVLNIDPLSFGMNPSNVFALGAPAAAAAIAPGTNRVFDLIFTPAAGQMYSGVLMIGSNDPALAGAFPYALTGSATMMCVPSTMDPGEPMNDTCATAIDRGSLALDNTQQSTSWADAVLYGANDNDWSLVHLTVDLGCDFVGYQITARTTARESVETCIYIGDCTTPANSDCATGGGQASVFMFPADDVCNQFGNNLPVYVHVRHSGGDLMCMNYSVNFTGR